MGLEAGAAAWLSPGCVRPAGRLLPVRGWWLCGLLCRGLVRPSRSCGGCRVPFPPNGSTSPKKGMLDRSMSTLMAFSRVAARTTLTSHVLSEWPDLAASSSALALTDSGIRRVTRARPPSSSTSSGVGGAGGGGGAGALAGARLDDEVELASVEAYVDAAGPHLGGDLGSGLGDGLHQREPGRGLQGQREPLGGLLGLRPSGLGGGDEVAAEAVDVRRDVHVHHYDTTVTSSQVAR